jgi:hypothetical protein
MATTNTTQQNKDYINGGGADDDQQNNSNSASLVSSSGYQKGNTASPSNKNITMGLGEGVPGKRPYNPLSQFSSYNYQISLYMMTPDALNRFVNNGRRSMEIDQETGSSGFFLLAQTGGKNWKNNDIAPGFELDLGIDNVVIEQAKAGQSTGSPVNGTTVAMTITEPNSISFASRLQEAAAALKTKLPEPTQNMTGIYNFYMLGIRFYGYDSKGELVTGKSYAESDVSRNDESAIFERFFELKMTEFKSKLSASTAQHQLKFAVVPTVALNDKAGRINFTTTINASTVNGALGSLINELNSQEAKSVKNKKIEIPHEYEIVYSKGSQIPGSKLVNPKADKDKSRSSPSTVKSSKSSNESASQKAAPDLGTKQFPIKGDVSVIQMIEKFIAESSYITDAISEMPTSNTDATAEEQEKIEKKNPKKLKWFFVEPVVTCKGYDKLRKDYAYKIAYHINEYDIPFLASEYVKSTTEMAGAYKKYNYFYTGKNTEVLSYEQQLDANYYIQSVVGGKGGNPDFQVPVIHNRRSVMESTGAVDKGAEAVNSIKTSLYEAASFMNARITIMGDPDYLAQPREGTGLSQTSIYGQDGYSIPGTTGQAFIEIKFNDVGDYSTSDGLLNRKPPISLWPQDIKSDERFKKENAEAGLFYIINETKSTFSGGHFKQELKLSFAPAKTTKSSTEKSEASGREGSPDKKVPAKTTPKKEQYLSSFDDDKVQGKKLVDASLKLKDSSMDDLTSRDLAKASPLAKTGEVTLAPKNYGQIQPDTGPKWWDFSKARWF